MTFLLKIHSDGQQLKCGTSSYLKKELQRLVFLIYLRFEMLNNKNVFLMVVVI